MCACAGESDKGFLYLFFFNLAGPSAAAPRRQESAGMLMEAVNLASAALLLPAWDSFRAAAASDHKTRLVAKPDAFIHLHLRLNGSFAH